MQARTHDIENLGRLKKRSDFLLAGSEGRKWVSKTVVVQVVDDPAYAAAQIDPRVTCPDDGGMTGSTMEGCNPDLIPPSPVHYAPLGGAYRNRFGVTASKKVGNAVERTRVKRRLRAAIKDIYAANDAGSGLQHGVAIVMIGRKETLTVDYKRLKGDLAWCLRRLGILTDSAPSAGRKMSQDAPHNTSKPAVKDSGENQAPSPMQGDGS